MLDKAKTGYFVRDPERNLVYCPAGESLRQKCIKKNGNIRYANKNACKHCPNQLSFLSRTSVYTSPAVPPWFTVWTVLFAKYLHISGNWRMPHVTGYLVCSVIFNLSLCPQRPIWQTAFPPGSHLPGFSVRAWLLWLPLHRFNLLNLYLIYHRKLYLSTLSFIQ